MRNILNFFSPIIEPRAASTHQHFYLILKIPPSMLQVPIYFFFDLLHTCRAGLILGPNPLTPRIRPLARFPLQAFPIHPTLTNITTRILFKSITNIFLFKAPRAGSTPTGILLTSPSIYIVIPIHTLNPTTFEVISIGQYVNRPWMLPSSKTLGSLAGNARVIRVIIESVRVAHIFR